MKNSLFIILAFLLWAGSSWAGVNGYTFTNSSGPYTLITGGIVLGTITNDDQVFNANTTGAPPPVTSTGFPIGFSFTYNGIVYDKFAVNTNGWILLGTGSFTIGASSASSNYTPISTLGPIGFMNVISALGIDLQGQSGSELSFKIEGISPGQVLTVQWAGYKSFGSAGTGDNYNFQIKLYENSNEIRFIYGPITKNTTARFPQVGIRGETNADFHNRTTTSSWTATSKGTINTQTCTLSQLVFPPEGLTFIFSPTAAPPNCANIVSPVDLATNVMISATLNWAAGSGGAPTGYILYLGTDYPPTNIVDGTNLGLVTTYDPIPDLLYLTNYYWKIVPTNDLGDAIGCPIWTFTTGPDPTITSFPFCESFEEEAFPPYEWTNLKTAGSGNPGTWNRQTTGTNPACAPHSGAGMARYNSYNLANGTTGILATPPINFPSDQYRVKFWMFRDDGYSTYSNELVNVYYNTAPSAAGGVLLGTIHRNYGLSPSETTANQWYEYNFDMPPGSGGNGRYVIFEAVSQYGNNMFIDDVCLVGYGNTLINAGTDRYTVTQGVLSFGESGTDYWTLPAGFFGPGSEPFTGSIYWKGQNSDGSQTPDGDISINRTADMDLGPPPSMGTVPTEMTQLNLASSAPVLVNYDFVPDSFFDVFLEISMVPGMGMYDIALENQNGGTYSLMQSFQPVITFVNTTDPSQVYTFTPETMGYPPLMLSSMAPYPWTLSPIPGEFDQVGAEEELVLHTPAGSTFSLAPLLERTNNNTMVEMNEVGVPASFSGNGYNGGEWYFYENTNWYNVWWYDHPVSTNRLKWIINPSITILPRIPTLTSSVEIVYTYSTPQWYTWTVAPRPPLPSDVPTPLIEEQLIQRSDPIFTYTGSINEPIQVPLITPYIIPWYNPEWISIDIRGYNFILNGLLNHVCWRPATKSVDFGDAPDPKYPTLLVNNGARHTIVPGIFMGNLVDAEGNGQPNATATGDDINPVMLDDEDGVTFNTPLNPGQLATITISSSIANALLQGWIDHNADGDWADAGEQIISNLVTVAGNNVVNFIVPIGAASGSTFSRFRLSTMPNLTYIDAAPNGEVEDHQVHIEILEQFDYGDAPDPTYPTLLASNGARHINTGLMLGVLIDVEPNGQPDGTATGDDINPAGFNDEDGIWWPCNFVPGHANTVKVTTNGPGFLNSWFDFNQDGDWADPGEQVFTNVALLPGITDLNVLVPVNAVIGATFTRFRFSSQINLSYTGLAQDGEVEDYLVMIHPEEPMDYGDAPDPTYPTLALSNGARHGNDPLIPIFLGNLIDWEINGLPSPNALGDDLDNIADEEGIVFNTPLIPGAGATITVTASIGGGAFQGWIDYNADGDWADAGEQIFNNIVLVAGPQPLNFNVSANAILGNTFARFRYSTMPNLSCYGCAPNGEVEDYGVLIGQPDEFDWGDLPDPPYSTLAASNGPNHKIGPLFLGQLIDNEIDGQPDPVALGDDLNKLADEDGVVFTSQIMPGKVASVTVTASLGGGLLQGCIDLMRDGDFNDPGEQIFFNQPLAAGINLLTFTVNPAAQPGPTFARFRLSTVQGLGCTGPAPDGEVEDYHVMIDPAPPELDFGDAPDPTYPTFLANNGARHLIDNITYLGALIDGEADGQPTPNADGDDLTNLADEDGVAIMWPLATGNPCKLKVTASVGDALFNCWIDFNGNGTWADPGEHVFLDLNLLAGDNYLNFITPCDATPGHTYLRCRFSHQPALSYEGYASDGEVEDYTVSIIEYGEVKWQQPPDPLLPGLHVGDETMYADDWVCCGDVVTDIHWWGNYELGPDEMELRRSGINHFLVHIYSNSNCLPGTILRSYVIPYTLALEVNTGLKNNEGSWIYKYDFLLPEPFIQVKDTTYWLSVQAISNDPQNPPSWRWQEANRWLFPIHCGAAQNLGSVWQTITWPFPPYVKYDDFAFAITSWVVDTLYLQNIDVTNGQDICYDANKVIIVAGGGSTFNVQNGGRATLIAGEKIRCLDGTKVFPGGYLHGYITTPDNFCNSLKTAMVASAVSTSEAGETPGMVTNVAGFKIYPNPTTGTFTLEVSETGEIMVDIYTMFGSKLLEKKVNGQLRYEFSLTTQPPGVYILHVVSGQDVGTVKVIKQ